MADNERAARRLAQLAEVDPEVQVPEPAVTTALLSGKLNHAEMIATVLAGYTDRPALGTRAYEHRRDATGRVERDYLPEYEILSYGELRRRIEGVASAWRHVREHAVEPGDSVAYISFSGADMATIDLATVYAQAVSVPLQANLPEELMLEALAEVEPVTLVASVEHVALAADYALRQPTIRSLIVIDCDEVVDNEREAIEAARAGLAAEAGDRIAVANIKQLIELGSAWKWSPLAASSQGSDLLAMIMYTSGSTGSPKGAIIHEAMLTQFWTHLQHAPIITMAYAPMNHFMGRSMIYSTMAQGGTTYFTLKPDLSTLLEDIRLARPTYLTFMPRFAEIVYQSYQAELQRRIAEGQDPQAADAAIQSEMRGSYLGDRLLSGAVGSSPTAPEVRAFLRDCFDLAFSDGYGSTENSGRIVTVNNHIIPEVVIDYKLRDVPELGYYTTDKPYPRGELLIKTKVQFMGYWKRPEATAQIFDEDGYVITGDIMEERSPGEIAWIDRRNNVIKLSQAEFVAIAPVEAAFLGNCPLVHQIYVYGSSYRAFLLAVVVPDVEVARARIGRDPTPDEMHDMVLAEMQQGARKAGLKSFEIPRDILIEMEPFSLENGLLTSVRKPSRPNLKKRYADRLEERYQEMDRKQQEELAHLRSGSSGASVTDRIAGAFKANLGLETVDPASPQSYRDMGGDSLGGVGLAVLMEEMFGIEVPVSIVLGPTASIPGLSRFVEAQLSGEGGRPTFAQVHGEDPRQLRASELTLDAFVAPAVLELASNLPQAPDEVRTVLLTGSTGFLGRFLALEWMERMASTGGNVICMVRAADAIDGRKRLDETFGTLDPDLAQRFASLAGKHLQVLAGDLDSPRFGLDAAEFDRLAQEVDLIVHPGALVNHLFSYANLFGPNVAATAELIGLALTGRKKRFDFVSSVAVPATNAGLRGKNEDADVRRDAPSMPIMDAYAMGYAASKWAGEVLLRDAHEKYGLAVNVYRADMILPHARFSGQINVPDMFTRLLQSIVMTGLAPLSFYELDNGQRPKVHYDGLPVDFLASVMREIGEQPHSGFATYNTINAHYDDGISLDTFVDWIISDGYKVDLIADYDEWLRRFSDKLRQLPDEDRAHSMINILAPHAVPAKAHQEPIRSERFVDAVKKLDVGPEIPHLTEGFIHKYLADMRALKLIRQGQNMELA